MKITPIKQPDDTACGPTCAQMILSYFKIPNTFKEIAKISQYKKRDGLSDKDFVETMDLLDLETVEVPNASWEQLHKANTKDKVVVVSWMKKGYLGHFSIVEKVNKDSIILVDPDEGKIVKLKKIIFMRLWMDYDDMAYPQKNTDIQLRWMCVVSKK